MIRSIIADEIRRNGWVPLLANVIVYLAVVAALLALTIVAWGMGQ